MNLHSRLGQTDDSAGVRDRDRDRDSERVSEFNEVVLYIVVLPGKLTCNFFNVFAFSGNWDELSVSLKLLIRNLANSVHSLSQ